MNDQSVMAPLAAFHGARPPAPGWFTRALAQTPERSAIEVEGARLEVLAWGERGRPGLVFLHGGAAHAHWWSFIAPFFAQTHRVVAPTFSGMGGSDWRDAYAFDQFVREAHEAAQAAGAFDAGPPVVVGHSFGGRIAMGLARDFGATIKCGVMVDPPFWAPVNRKPGSPPRPSKLRVPALDRSDRRALPARARTALREPVHPRPYRPPFHPRDAGRGGRAGLVAVFRSAFLGEVHADRPGCGHCGGALPAGPDARRQVATLPRCGCGLSYEPAAARRARNRDSRSRAPCDDRPAARLRRRAAGLAFGLALKSAAPEADGEGQFGLGPPLRRGLARTMVRALSPAHRASAHWGVAKR